MTAKGYVPTIVLGDSPIPRVRTGDVMLASIHDPLLAIQCDHMVIIRPPGAGERFDRMVDARRCRVRHGGTFEVVEDTR